MRAIFAGSRGVPQSAPPSSPSADDLSFDAATALRPRADGSTFDLDIHPLWTVGDKPNGGFLLALLGRAAAQAIGADAGAAWDVQSATVTYLAAPALEAAEIRTTLLRRGRTASHVRAVLVQSERTWSTPSWSWAHSPRAPRPATATSPLCTSPIRTSASDCRPGRPKGCRSGCS
jgi:hypothetical protein